MSIFSNTFHITCKRFFFLILVISQVCCNKLVEIPPPVNTITTGQVFADSADAAAAILGIYSSIQYGSGGLQFYNGAETIFCGLSADELVSFNSGDYLQFYSNMLDPREGNLYQYCWQQPYNYIYQANACIESLENSKNMGESARRMFVGEAKFFRCLFYFYLINLFGDVPYVTSTDWRHTDTISRANKQVIYSEVIKDLKDAIDLLPSDYFGGKRTRINKQAAIAFLARVYLFVKDWKNAEIQSSAIINDGRFYLEPNLDDVFSINSGESILQWQLNTAYSPYNCTFLAFNILPSDTTLPPIFYASSQLLNSFEENDKRRIQWFSQSVYNGTTYTYPYKYKIGQQQQKVNGAAREYFTVFRLAEQYLIRAEARVQLGNLSGAAGDLNFIRSRAGIQNTTAATQSDLLAAILHERQVELFVEWGHRWFDLKRMGQIDAVMSLATPLKNTGTSWQSHQQLYPIPLSQLTLNPFLQQNPGYQ